MRKQAAVKIDREIGGTEAEMPEEEPPKVSDQAPPQKATQTVFEAVQAQDKKEWNGLRDDDKRPPLRRSVHAESQRQTHLQERVRQDTRGLRGKARRADQNHESRNRSREEKGKKGIRKGGRPRTVAPQKLRCSRQRKRRLRCFGLLISHRQIKHNRKYGTQCTRCKRTEPNAVQFKERCQGKQCSNRKDERTEE